MFNQRRVVLWTILGLFLGMLPAGQPVAAERAPARPGAAERRPNILFAIADDQSWAHTGASGDRVVKTPTFDRVAREGVLFTHAFCSAPSCTPSRAAVLTGQAFWRLEEGAVLWGTLPKKFAGYPDLLEAAGYHVGMTGKGWGPGDLVPGGRTRNPAGPGYASFQEFLRSVPEGKPFCFWFGSRDPHRPYEPGSGAQSGKDPAAVQVPPFLPDDPTVRGDILDYYFEIERYDRDVGEMLRLLEAAGRLENTIVVMTADNGMPFPRAKGNVYDYGARLPLAVRWPARVPGGRRIDDFISFTDFAPTFLEAAGLKPRPEMTGRSFLSLLTSDRSGRVDPRRDRVYLGRERHANCREGVVGYPIRAVRTERFLYLRNLAPDRWPAGDPERYGDIDNGPAKSFMMERRESPAVRRLFQLAFEKRPAEELYDLRKDPAQMTNVAEQPAYAAEKRRLRAELDRHLKETGDPRASGKGDVFDRYLYYGRSGPNHPLAPNAGTPPSP